MEESLLQLNRNLNKKKISTNNTKVTRKVIRYVFQYFYITSLYILFLINKTKKKKNWVMAFRLFVSKFPLNINTLRNENS